MSARLQRLAAALLPWLLLFGCKHRVETHQETTTEVHQAAEDSTEVKADTTVEVKTVDAPDRTTTIINTYYPPEPLPPAVPGKPPPVRPPPALKSHTERVEEHGAVTTDKTVKAEVAVDHHASSTTEGHTDTKADTVTVTDVGLSWVTKLWLALLAAAVLFALYRFTPPGRAIAALLSRFTS